MPRGKLKHRYFDSSPTLQISLDIVALFEKLYGEPILTVVSNIGEEDVQYRCFK